MAIGSLAAAAVTSAVNSAVSSATSNATLSGMDALRNTIKALSQSSDGSLVGVSQSGRVEPICLIDAELNGHSSLSDTLQALQSVFAAYYLRAFAMTTNIGGISVAGRLDPLSTSRNPLNSFIVSNEDYDDKLPMYDKPSLESYGDPYIDKLALEASAATKKESTKIDTGSAKPTDLTDASNLVTGKVVNVKIEHNGNSVVVPLAIRLNCVYMASNPLAGILNGVGADYSFSERWAQLKHGGISFWRDFVLCQDIIDEHKRNLDEDKTGIYLAMMQRRAANNAASITSGGNVSLNNASNLIVISKETLSMVEAKLGISFDSFNQRQKIFENGYLMLVFVLDRRWGRATLYTRGIKDTTTVSFSDLKSSEKSGGPDIGDILAAFRAGTSATL